MNEAKYIGLDVHQATLSVSVLDSSGKLLMEAILETKAATVLQFIHGLRGSLHVTFEEGTCALWLHDLLKSYVTEVLVCDPRKNALLKSGNKNDRVDARKLADLLRTGLLPVYHGEHGIRPLKELARSYMAITRDLNACDGAVESDLPQLGDSLEEVIRVPGDLIKEWVGHTSLKITSGYTHFDDAYRQDIIKNLK